MTDAAKVPCPSCGRIIVKRRRSKSQPRQFDYAEARRLRWAEGWSVRRIADHLGVTTSSIYYACSAYRRAYTRSHARARTEANQAARALARSA